jgi:hypothetical protein
MEMSSIRSIKFFCLLLIFAFLQYVELGISRKWVQWMFLFHYFLAVCIYVEWASCRHETYCHLLGQENRLRVLENTNLRRIFWISREKVIWGLEKTACDAFHSLYNSRNAAFTQMQDGGFLISIWSTERDHPKPDCSEPDHTEPY